jgi:hypothetical protein
MGQIQTSLEEMCRWNPGEELKMQEAERIIGHRETSEVRRNETTHLGKFWLEYSMGDSIYLSE